MISSVGHFPKWPTQIEIFNISASSQLRIVILVSKHTHLGAMILLGSSQISSGLIGRPFSKMTDEKLRFFNISASSSVRIVILVSKHTHLGAMFRPVSYT